MGLMDKMMERMIKNMSIAEKEEMMLKMMPVMMPIMMEGMDINKMMPGMMTATGSLITVSGIFNFITKALKDEAFKKQLGEIKDSLPALAEKMQSMMSMMMMAMPDMMSGMMDFMGNNIMPLMMPLMHKMMPVMMKEKMPEIMQRHDTMKEMMPSMMMEVMPDCVETMVPLVEQEKQAEFISRLNVAMDKAGLAYQNK